MVLRDALAMVRPRSTTVLLGWLGLWTLLVRPVLAGSWQLGSTEPGQVPGQTIVYHETKAWPNGSIPYNLHGLPHWLSQGIRQALRLWEQRTCVRFVPKADSSTWAEFTDKGHGCHAAKTGYPGPGQGEVVVTLHLPSLAHRVLTLGDKGCGASGVPAHEVGHVIGLIHEQQRSDASQYVRVIWDNVPPDEYWKAQVRPLRKTENSGRYDYHSIMHYSANGNSRGDADSLVSVTNQTISPDKNPTVLDYDAVNRMYKCPASKTLASPDCVEGPAPANGDFSSYTFRVDEQTVGWMRMNGYDTIGLLQICSVGHPANGPTTNWAYVPLGNSAGGPDQAYTAKQVPRCKKDHSRHVNRYQVLLCKGRRCDVSCQGSEEGRKLCPTLNGKRIDSKAITVDDKKLWICHAL